MKNGCKTFLCKTAAAGALTAFAAVFAAPAAFAASAETSARQMDMTSWPNVLTAFAVFLGGGFAAALVAALRSGRPGGLKSAFALFSALLFAAVPALDNVPVGGDFTAVAPAVFAQYAAPGTPLQTQADLYVSPAGDDAADGSLAHPLRTVERARDLVRAMDKTGKQGVTVALMAGEYRVNGLTFTSEDGGTQACPVTYCAYGDGEVVLNAGLHIPAAAFTPVTDVSFSARLHGPAKRAVVCADLFALGLTPEDYGDIHAIGAYNTGAQYPGGSGPQYSELFVDGARCQLARYPDTGFLAVDEVVSEGGARTGELPPTGDVLRVNADLAARIRSWQTTDGVWMMGYWKYDWADGSTPIGGFDAASRTLTAAYYSHYGVKQGAPYYFFNVAEELTVPGEWYLDRENGKLYLYPPAGFSESGAELTLSTAPVISAYGANYLTFAGLTVKGTRGNGVTLYGDRVTVYNCNITGVGGTAVVAEGTGIAVTDCDISHTGRGGVYLNGGDEISLTPGDCRAENNYIHDWSEVYLTYQPGVSLYGVGNVCAHNEFCNSPHEAVTYSGCLHRVAYNRIYRVCLLSQDAGAIYAGRSWNSYGSRVEYNCIYDLGSGDFRPCGIYMDDALSGQTIVGNLLVNIPGNALMLGGGRDLDVRNNVVVSGGERGIYYDQRAIDGVNGGWFAEHSAEGGSMWRELYASPWQTPVWQSAFPQMAAFSDDFSHPEDPAFVPNPANSTVCDNLFVTGRRSVGQIDEKVREYSTFTGNGLFAPSQLELLFRDPANGDYRLAEGSPMLTLSPVFRDLPIEQMGRCAAPETP